MTVIKKWLQRNFSEPEAVFLTVLLVVAVLACAFLGNILIPIIISVIIAYILSSAVDGLMKLKIPHWLAVVIIYLLFISIFLLFLIWLLPMLFQQLGNLFIEIPKMLQHGQTFLIALQAKHPDLVSAAQVQSFISQINNYLTTIGQFILSYSLATLSNVITVVVYLILVPLLVFFFLKDKNPILKWLQRFLPQENKVLGKIGSKVKAKIGDYVKGKLIEFVIVAVVTVIAFMLLRVHYAVLLGVGVGLSVFIPYIGAVLITIPVVIVTFFQWGISSHLLYVMLVYAIIMLIDANVLVPILFSETMKIHPVVIVLAVLVFGSLWGFWGVFFAIPLATVINTLMKEWPRKIEEK